MEENNTAGTDDKIAVGGFANSMTSPKPIAWVVIILLSLLIPPLGVLAAAFLAFKAFRDKTKKLYLMAAVAFGAAIIGVGALYAVQRVVYNLKLDHYKYSQLDEYKLEGNLEGVGIAFKKPTDFKQTVKNVELGRAWATLEHQKKDNKRLLGVMNTTITNSALASAKDYPETLGKVFETKGKGYDDFEKRSKEYLATFLPEGMDIQISQPGEFKNPNISKNAWLFTFVASGKSGGSDTATVIKGVSVLAVGKKSFYNFSFGSVDYNWTDNKKVWQQVLDSLKIDQ